MGTAIDCACLLCNIEMITPRAATPYFAQSIISKQYKMLKSGQWGLVKQIVQYLIKFFRYGTLCNIMSNQITINWERSCSAVIRLLWPFTLPARLFTYDFTVSACNI